jgi:hypothetical protein
MSTQLQAYADAFREAESELLRLTRSLSDAQFNWKPDDTSWSIGECIAHLNRVAEAYLPRLEAAASRTEPTAQGPFTYGFMTRRMIDAMNPGGPALSTSRSLNPSDGGARSALDRTQTLEALSAYTDRYVAACEEADGLDLAKIKVRYPFFWLLRLPLGAFLEITGVHALRHARQAVGVREQPGFPVGSEEGLPRRAA